LRQHRLRAMTKLPLHMTMTDFSLVLPADFEDYAWEVQAKGCFADAILTVAGRCYRLNFYDPTRLNQEIESELERGVAFAEPNLVIVRAVTRSNMQQAAEMLAQSGQANTLVAD
jgi:hypothetical protein